MERCNHSAHIRERKAPQPGGPRSHLISFSSESHNLMQLKLIKEVWLSSQHKYTKTSAPQVRNSLSD